MIALNVPGRGNLRLSHVVLGVNGTIARDGRLLDNVAKPLTALRDRLSVHLLTADT
jgi:soluble P-type ATPase